MMTTPPLIAPASAPEESAEPYVRDTVHWLERAVIGLNLCPFAKAVHVKGQIHYAVTLADDPAQVLDVLRSELTALALAEPERRDTTLLVVQRCLTDFIDFNDFLDTAEAVLEELDLVGTQQIASFHPRYQFAGTAEDDVSNCTNRSPYPTLHLLREDSIDRTVAVFPEAETIYERNMEVLRRLGLAGWKALAVTAGGARIFAPNKDEAPQA